ncbi:MAG: hypothetical protein ACI311_00630 [Bacilli bacterium]
MKKRNLFLLPLLVLGSTGLTSLMTSCKDDPIVVPGPEEPGPEEPGPEEPGPEEPVVVAPTSIAFAEDSLELKVGNSVFLPAVTVLPENATDKSFTVTNGNEAVVTLVKDGDNYGLTAVAPGDAVITVASVANPELTDTLNVHVPEVALPTPVSATIAEMNAKTSDDTKNLYEVTGVVSWIKSKTSDAYGNLRLATDDGSEDILVYGSTKDASSIAYDASYTNLVFTNPKDFVTGGLASEIDLGDVITLVCVYKYFNSTPEIMGYVKPDSIVKSETRPNYNASVEVTKVGELGGATLSKTEGICIGEELTLTVDIPEGYEAVVKLNGEELIAESVGSYKFTAMFTNELTVSFVEPAAPVGNITYVMNDIFATAGLGTTYKAVEVIDSGNTWAFSNGGKSKPSSSDVITEAHPMIVSKGTTSQDSYLTITTKYSVTGLVLNGFAWGNDSNTVECTIETSVDGGTTWVALSSEGSSYTMTDGTQAAITMSGTFDATKLVRIHVHTTDNKLTKNNRLMVASVVLTYPEVA